VVVCQMPRRHEAKPVEASTPGKWPRFLQDRLEIDELHDWPCMQFVLD
jgi:hypothetical protein